MQGDILLLARLKFSMFWTCVIRVALFPYKDVCVGKTTLEENVKINGVMLMINHYYCFFNEYK